MHIDSLIESKKLIIDDVVLNDRLHLSLKGHEIYFDFIFKKLENQINKKFKE